RHLNRLVRGLHFGRRHFDGEPGDARRLPIDSDFQDVQRRAAALEQCAQRAPPAFDVLLGRRRVHGQPHRHVARVERGEARVERRGGREFSRPYVHRHGIWRGSRFIEDAKRRAGRLVADRDPWRRGIGGGGGGGRKREGQRAENRNAAALTPPPWKAVLLH